MKQFLILATASLLTLLGLSSCSVSTPQTRIEKNPAVYSSLSERDRALASKGEITKGMSRDGVFIAWGEPESRGEGQSEKGRFERWNYVGLRPVYHQSYRFGFGYGSRYGYGYRGRYGRGYYPYSSYGTSVNYVPYRSAWVDFKNGRVNAWQRGGRSF